MFEPGALNQLPVPEIGERETLRESFFRCLWPVRRFQYGGGTVQPLRPKGQKVQAIG